MNDLTPVTAAAVPPRAKPSSYPAPFAARMEGRVKRPLGDLFGLTSFGVNHTTLAPGAASSLQHVHTRQDEFVFVLSGEATLVSGDRAWRLGPGDCAGFKAGGASHHLENRSDEPCVYLEIGDRTPGDSAAYPADDLRAELVDGVWVYSRKDGTPY